MVRWEFVSVALSGESMGLGTLWECPDYFKLGDRDVILLSTVSATPSGVKMQNKYSAVWLLGRFDLKTGIFQVEQWDQLDDGTDFYAPQTTRGRNRERIMIAWQQSWERNIPPAELGHNWAGHMTLPRELECIGDRICQKPAIDSACFEGEAVVHNNVRITGQQTLSGVRGNNVYLRVCADLSGCDTLTISLYKKNTEATALVIDGLKKQILLDRSHGGYPIAGAEMVPGASNRCASPLSDEANEIVTLEIFLDSGAIEVFCKETGRCLTSRVYPKLQGEDITFEAKGEAIISVEAHQFLTGLSGEMESE
jgi:beta-fructofuranosidase